MSTKRHADPDRIISFAGTPGTTAIEYADPGAPDETARLACRYAIGFTEAGIGREAEPDLVREMRSGALPLPWRSLADRDCALNILRQATFFADALRVEMIRYVEDAGYYDFQPPRSEDAGEFIGSFVTGGGAAIVALDDPLSPSGWTAVPCRLMPGHYLHVEDGLLAEMEGELPPLPWRSGADRLDAVKRIREDPWIEDEEQRRRLIEHVESTPYWSFGDP